jgi:hypothetical protein
MFVLSGFSPDTISLERRWGLMRIAVFVSRAGVERIVPAGGATLEDSTLAVELQRFLQDEIAAFDRAIRRKVAQQEARSTRATPVS